MPIMDTLGVDESGRDLNWELVSGQESVRQRVVQLLRTHLGEWFLAAQRGVPYLGGILRVRIGFNLAGRIVAHVIRTQVTDINRIISIDVSRVEGTRNVNVSVIAVIDSGEEISVNVEV